MSADRWTRDRWSFTGHRDRVRAGEPPQPRRDDAVTAAQQARHARAANRPGWTRRRPWTTRWSWPDAGSPARRSRARSRTS